MQHTLRRPISLVLFFFAFTQPALAIPSPELIIGSAASFSQLFAIGTALLGGSAAAIGHRRGRFSKFTSSKFMMIVLAGLVAALLASLWFNVTQFQSTRSENLARLQATLIRPAMQPGQDIADPNLKETSLTSQNQSELGISTLAMTEVLEHSSDDVFLVDVREDAEFRMGTIPGATHIRFPDFDSSSQIFLGKKLILFCHNGNRSAETCAALAKLGIDCRFVVGGIEKWIVEGRAFSDPTVRGLEDLRAIPDYQNKDVLLDTAAIKTLSSQEDIQFVDLRYPGEFAQGHLPGAINIPLRATPSARLKQEISNLPNTPIVAACYDRRGCFMAQVLGLTLTEAGYDYRGRYTLPWEYFVPPPLKPHIVNWLADRQRSTWHAAVDGLATSLVSLAGKSSFLLVLLGLAIVSRLLVLPLAVKAERDQITLRRKTAELLTLKQSHAKDPTRRAEEIRKFNRENGLTPGRNLLVLMFLPVTMLGLASVQAASSGQSGFFWFAALGQPDPFFALPVFSSLLACLYLAVALGSSKYRLILCWALGFPLLYWLTAPLTAAGNLYLICALCLLFIQRAWITGGWNKVGKIFKNYCRGWAVRYRNAGIINLRDSKRLSGCGNKIIRLSKMVTEGIPVPPGIVLNAAWLEKYQRSSDQEKTAFHHRIAKLTGHVPVAVRSSAAAEDGENLSFAGVFESCINVAPLDLGPAIAHVFSSFNASHSKAYGHGGDGNILIQRMVNAQYSGVLFTQRPNAPGQMMLEMVEGTAEALVSGKVTPRQLAFGRYSLTAFQEPTALDFTALLKMGQKIETLFGLPQDIEWTFTDGRFFIVQSRDITSPGLTDPTSQEMNRLLEDAKDQRTKGTLYQRDENAEILPVPTPLSLSYMQALWAPGGSVHRACDRLGLRYHPGHDPYLVTIFGRLYSHLDRKSTTQVQLTRRCIRNFDGDPDQIFEHYQQVYCPMLDQKVELLAAVDFSALSAAALEFKLQEIFKEYIEIIHVEVEVVNIAASYFTQKAIDACKISGVDAAQHLSSESDNLPSQILSREKTLGPAAQLNALKTWFGHRAPYDYELSAPRYREDPDLLQNLFGVAKLAPVSASPNQNNSLDTLGSDSAKNANAVQSILLAQQFQSLKEAAKHQSLKFLAEIRRATLALDEKLEMDGGAFFIRLQEYGKVHRSADEWRQRSKNRIQMRQKLMACPMMGRQISLADLEQQSGPEGQFHSAAGTLRGLRVSGLGTIEAPVYRATLAMAEAGAPLSGFITGHILVCPYIHPSWLQEVLTAGGVVSEVGGWLSHMAIVAREHNIPMIVAFSGIEKIETGILLRLNTDGSAEVLPEHQMLTAKKMVTS